MSDATPSSLIPICAHIWKTYLTAVKSPVSIESADAMELIGEMKKLDANRAKLMEFVKTLGPFKRHIIDHANKLLRINEEAKQALAENNAEGITRAWFGILTLLLGLKMWRGTSMPLDKYERDINFTPEEKGFIDNYFGLDLAMAPGGPKLAEPLLIMGQKTVDKKELMKGDEVISPDYEESPIRTKIREYVKQKYGIERMGEFGGTNIPLPSGHYIKQKKVLTDVVDIHIFTGMSQFLSYKYDILRRGVYRPLANERQETGEAKSMALKFTVEDGKPVETPGGATSAELFFFDPATVVQKLGMDLKLIDQSLMSAAKKVDKDYFFNAFYHLQSNLARSSGEEGEEAPAAAFGERFEPSETDDRVRRRERLAPEKLSELLSVMMKIDPYIFGGHIDMDIYMDSIGIRRKPNVLLLEGEGAGCYDYTNNLLVIPAICPMGTTALDQVLAALADFRFTLWIDSPKDIFNEQGVGFPISGKRKKTLANKPLWSLFQTKASSLIKQKAFKDMYRRHVYSFLQNEGIREVCGLAIPITNNITESALRQFFNAYCMLANPHIKPKADGAPAAPAAPAHTPAPGQAPKPAQAAAPPAAPKPAAPVAAPAAPRPAAPPPPAPVVTPPAPVSRPAPAPVAPVAAPKPAAPVAVPQAPAAPAAGIVCGSCKMSLPPNSRFCLQCGTPVAPAIPHCIMCNAELIAGARFCNQCGAIQP